MTTLSIITEDNEVTFPNYTGSGPLPFTFPYFQKEDLNVEVDGVALTQSEWDDTPNAVDGGNDGGSILLNVAVAGKDVRIWRDTVRLRASQFGVGGAGSRQIDAEFNRVVTMIQDRARNADELSYTQGETNVLLSYKIDGAIAATYAAARLLAGIVLGGVVVVRGRAAVGDGGQGLFRVTSGSEADDGGMVLVMADGKRLVRETKEFRASHWVVGDGTTNDTTAFAAWAASVKAAATAGACVAVIDRKIALASQVNLNDWGSTGKLSLRYEGAGEIVIHSSVTTTFIPLNISGGGISGTPTTITTNVTENSATVIVASATGLAVGDYVYFDHQVGTTTHRGMVNRIAAIAGTTLTMEELIPFEILVASGTTIFRKILLQQGLHLRDMRATGDRGSTADASTSMTCQYLLNPNIKGVETASFVSAGAVFQYIYGGLIHDVTDHFSGNGAVGYGLFCDGLTRVDVCNWKSIESNGYSGIFHRSAHCTFRAMSGRDSAGRGLEWYGSSGNIITDVTMDKAGATGVSIVYGCQNNQFSNIRSTRATNQSVWSNGNFNTGNSYDGIIASGSGSGVDISISGNDSRCSFRNINRVTTIDPNAPADTYFEYAQRDFVRAYYNTNTALTTGANRVLIFDTEDSDPFGSYNNATGLWTAGVSALVRITIQLNALSDFTGNNAIGLGGGQARNNKTTLIRDANQNIIYITNVWMRKGETIQPYINLGANVTINGQSDISLLLIEELGGVRGVAA